MPELPEVTTIKNDLLREVLNKKIIRVQTYQKYPLKPSNILFNKFVVGHEILKVDTIGKLITFELSSGYYLAIHLNMTGNLLYNVKDKYIKISLHFDTNDTLYYSTVRKLGYFELWDQNKINTYMLRVGKNVLDPNLEAHHFAKLIKSSNMYIKSVLLNQRLISGIGNIYANDALFMSKIHPKVNPKLITDEQYKLLFENVQKILKESINNRGSSIDRYKDIYGKPGTHQNYFRVYGKKGLTCTQCGSCTISYDKIQGRGTYFCEKCQIF